MGIGGGGDVVGALAAAGVAAAGGTPSVLGGLTWERRPIDPLPGPRRLAELRDAEPLNAAVALARPGTTGPGGFRFAEARMAELLGEPTLLVDPHGGPAAVADGLGDAAERLGADVVVLLDVGGDVLAHGDEPGLASPLADAVVLAAAPALAARGVTVLGGVFGAGCDGELTPEEVVERLAEVAAAGGALGEHALDAPTLERLEAAVAAVPTEASLMALRCARGERGEQPIRDGRRRVRLTQAGGRLSLFDPAVALRSAARLAAAVAGAASLAEADALLAARGVRTELAYEREAAAHDAAAADAAAGDAAAADAAAAEPLADAAAGDAAAADGAAAMPPPAMPPRAPQAAPEPRSPGDTENRCMASTRRAKVPVAMRRPAVRAARAILAPLAALAAPLAAAPPAPAAAPVAPYRANDAGGFRDVLPPGANGRASLAELGAFLATGARPAHNDDQLRMYADLVRAAPGLRAEDLPRYFKDASFGVRPGDVESTISPRDDVTIVRDKGFGVPHVYGTTRAGAMFGLGYATAQDRLFFIDVLRHLGRAQLSRFVGGAPGNRAMDAEQWAIAPYTEADLQRQVDQGDDLYGAEGRRLQDDAAAYVDGINRYIAEARLDPTKMPGEYAAIGRPQGPDDWKATDVVATASLVGGIFGKGGGRELAQAELLRAFRDRFGARRGRRLWRQFAAFDDPDAPTTVKHRRFPYQTPPRRPARGAEVLYDRGSFRPQDTVVAGSGSGERPAVPLPATPGPPGPPGVPGLPVPGLPVPGLASIAALPQAMSNALVVSARRSASGHPLAVFGPQVGYFAPQILMEQDVHAPGIDARGAAFPGVNLYVQMGRGRDYSWSATSAGQDIIDTFAVPLCDATHYRLRDRCRPIEVLERRNSWTPNAADRTPPGSETLRAERTALGLVAGRGRVHGRPVLFTALRSTYFHEVDSARGFADFNDPASVTSPQSFMRAAAKIGYTFNWFYVDADHTAYFNSGDNPLRARGTTGQLPMAARLEWRGFDPVRARARYLPAARHPHVVDQDWTTSWNNRQAPGYAGADSNLFSSVYRSQMLDRQVARRLRGGRGLTLPGLVEAMEAAATTDLRGMIPLPLALRVLGAPRDGRLRAAAATLRAWARSGAHRIDRDGDGRYDDADAVRLMDAWWPRLVRAMFRPRMGARLYERLTATYELDNAPNNHGQHLGSAYQEGFYGYVAKDLRRVLGVHQRRPYAVGFCGDGRRTACRGALLRSLRASLDVPASALYGGDEQCRTAGRDGDQACFDSVGFRALGGVTQPLIPWVNRPTYQQVVEIQGRVPR